MNRFALLTLCFLAAMSLSAGGSTTLEPTLEPGEPCSWPSVQGGGSGNPCVAGSTDLTGGKSRRERFTGTPAWIVSTDLDRDGKSDPGVLFADGTFRCLTLDGDRLRTISLIRKLSPLSPPVVLSMVGGEETNGFVGIEDGGNLVTIDGIGGRTRRLSGDFSASTYPVAGDFDGDGQLEVAGVTDKGHLAVVRQRTSARSERSATLLPDTRIIALDLDGDNGLELIALTGPTDEQAPGQLGDDLEARGFAVFSWDGRSLDMEDEFYLDEGSVFEMLLPVAVAGSDGAGPRLMLTVSEKGKGVGLRSYTYSGGRIREAREGPVLDQGLWIHPLGSASFGDSDRISLAAAILPEEGDGDLELYRTDLAQTRVTLRKSTRTHLSGSRLVETSLVGDFDGDGRSDLLVPGSGMKGVQIVTMDRSRIKGREIFTDSSPVSTNFSPGDYNGDRKMDVMFGLEDGTLVILFGE